MEVTTHIEETPEISNIQDNKVIIDSTIIKYLKNKI